MKIDYNKYTVALIDLEAFKKNVTLVRSLYPNTMIILPVKANAYGHGDVIIAKEAQRLQIEYLGIARVEEGVILRKNRIKLPIINFGIESGDNIKIALKNNIELTVHSKENIFEILNNKRIFDKKINIHLKVDTGMRRLGCSLDEVDEIISLIKKYKIFNLKSVYTHYADSGVNTILTQNQTDLFVKVIKKIRNLNINVDFIHCFNSGAIISPPKVTFFDYKKAIRPGIMVYGYSPFISSISEQLLPVMTLKSRVIHLKKVPAGSGISYSHTYVTDKETYIATIPLGYGDGFPRILSNKFMVTINGKHYKQIGTISMDLMVIEVDETVRLHDEVIIFGKKEECINTAETLASLCGTISYEITTSLTGRIKRIPVEY